MTPDIMGATVLRPALATDIGRSGIRCRGALRAWSRPQSRGG